MLKLRTVLLCNYPYYIMLFLVIIITFVRLQIPKVSNYNESSTSFTGKILEYHIDGNKLTLEVLNHEKIIANYYFKSLKEKNKFLNNVKLGVKVKCKGEFYLPEENVVFNGFSYKDYLYKENIFYLMSLDSYKVIDDKESFYYKIKNNFYKRINKLKSSSYLKTFLLGDKSDIDKSIIESYQYLGISHLFAISGMHITLLSGILLKLLKKLKVEEEKRYYVVMFFLLFYLLLVGVSASVLRAVIFFFLFSINKIYYFYIKPLNIFILTLSICLLISPCFIYDIGFLFSFSISFSLIYFSDILNKRKYYLSKLFITSLISFLISIPISLCYFYQVNFMSIIYNLFYVPFVSVILFPFSLITYIFPFLDNILFCLINILESSVDILSKVNFGILIFPKLNLFYYISLFIFIIIVIKFRYKIFYLILFIILIGHYFYMDIMKEEFITFIDVGQGDSTLFYSNGKTMLVDTGGKMVFDYDDWKKKKNNNSIVKNITIPYLKSLGIRKIDYLVLTHGDYDHLGETLNLLDNFKVDNIYINEGKINYLEKKISQKHKIKKLKQGDSFSLATFSIFSLNKDLGEENDSSLVLYVKNNDFSILMMGDATVHSEKEILNTYNIGHIDIIKIGHHGSRTSSSLEFLKEISPNVAIISAGRDNKFGHPHKIVLDRLKKENIFYFITAKDNSIKIDFKRNTFSTVKKNVVYNLDC